MKTIEEKNRMIAEFMGYVRSGFNGELVFNTETREEFEVEQLKYHTSWDWLMPVVDKIEVLSFYVDIYSINAATASKCQISKHSEDKVISSAVSYNKKEAVYESVIQFIEWYNENK